MAKRFTSTPMGKAEKPAKVRPITIKLGQKIKTTDGQTTTVCGYLVSSAGLEYHRGLKEVIDPYGSMRFYSFGQIVKRGSTKKVKAAAAEADGDSIFWGT